MNNQNFDNNQDFNNQNTSAESNQNFTDQNEQFNPDYSYMQSVPTQKDEKTAEGEKKASTSKILGIVGLVVGLACCGVAGLVLNIISIVMASTSKALLGYEHSDAKTGRVCSIIGIVISVLSVIFYILYVVFVIMITETNFHI